MGPEGAPRGSVALEAAIAATLRDHAMKHGTGGAAMHTRRLDRCEERYFLKFGPVAARAALEAEAAALALLAGANAVRVPAVLTTGECADGAWLLLEWLELQSSGRDARLGLALALLHRVTAPQFGWDRDNTIGATPQRNGCLGDWTTFFRDRRIVPMVERVARDGYTAVARAGERLIDALPSLLDGHAPPASLLHGDLWSGNAAMLRDGTRVIYDPATYYGDRETDLAMTELFGGFEPSFYAAYRESWPLDAGYGVRRPVYQLYHVLNHLHLFGGGYERQARDLIAHTLAQTG